MLNFPQPAILQQQLNNSGGPGVGFTNADCARPLAGCSDPTDPNSSLTEAGQLLTDHSNGLSASHEFQITIDKRFSGGFNLRGAYTLAKTIDVQSGFRARSSLQTDPLVPILDPRFGRFGRNPSVGDQRLLGNSMGTSHFVTVASCAS